MLGYLLFVCIPKLACLRRPLSANAIFPLFFFNKVVNTTWPCKPILGIEHRVEQDSDRSHSPSKYVTFLSRRRHFRLGVISAETRKTGNKCMRSMSARSLSMKRDNKDAHTSPPKGGSVATNHVIAGAPSSPEPTSPPSFHHPYTLVGWHHLFPVSSLPFLLPLLSRSPALSLS